MWIHLVGVNSGAQQLLHILAMQRVSLNYLQNRKACVRLKPEYAQF